MRAGAYSPAAAVGARSARKAVLTRFRVSVGSSRRARLRVSDETPHMESGSSGPSVERDLEDADQSSSGADQTAADMDQTASDVDQSASERDQRASDRDQAAADADQAEADAAHGTSWDETRRSRSHSSLERDVSTHARLAAARGRDHIAELRDRNADARDAAANVRDELHAALDGEMAEMERVDATLTDDPDAVLAALMAARRLAAGARARAAIARTDAARDREAARADRRQATLDRETANAELAREGHDYLTGALRRRAGLARLTHELARARRAQQPLLVAFVDVDGLKAVNDEYGHAAGDRLLRAVAEALEGMLRPYDIVIRHGGDEFVCVLCDEMASNIESRFEAVLAKLATEHRARLSVGFTEARPDEPPEQVIARADAAMIAARQARRYA